MKFLKNLIIFMAIAFKLLIYIINQTITNSPLIAYLYIIMFFFLAIPFLLKLEFNKWSFIKTFIILIISFLMFIFYVEDNIFIYAIVALISLDDDNKDIVKKIFYSGSFIFLLTLFLGIIELLPLNEVYRTLEGTTEIRNSLGFPNANAVFIYFVPLVLSGIYIYNDNKKKKIIFSIISLIFAIILFSYCKSRTGFYLSIIIIALSLISKNTIYLKNTKYHFLFFSSLSILLAFLFGRTKYNFVNKMLSGRCWYYLNYLKLGPLHWGKGVPDNIILDNLYIRLLANYSIFGFLLYLYIFYKGAKLLSKDKCLLFCSVIFLIYGIFESATVINFVIILFLKEIFNSYRCIYEKN